MLVATLAACSLPARAVPSTVSPESAKATSAADLGGLAALADLAKREGTVVVTGADRERDGNAAVIRGFQAAYGLAVRTSATAGDVLVLPQPASRERATGLAAYRPQGAASVPDALKDPAGRWTGEFATVVSIGYAGRLSPAPATWADLARAEYRGKVALADDPRRPGAALDAFVTVALARGGTAAEPGAGIGFFAGLRDSGALQPVPASDGQVASGQTAVVVDLEQAQLARKAALGAATPWRVVVPPGQVVAEASAVGVSADAKHPAAARLWLEYVLSDAAQNLRLAAGLRPARLAAMVAAGTQDKQAYAALPLLQGTPVYLTAAQESAAVAAVAAGWQR